MTERSTKRTPTTNAARVGAEVAPATGRNRGTFTLERVLHASVERVWDLWTTTKGLESWWGPDGFTTKFRRLEARPGGELEYVMTATGPEQIQMLESLGVPTSTTTRGTFLLVEPRTRLELMQVADFLPGVPPYHIGAVVELHTLAGGGVRLVVVIEKMHNAEWTKNAQRGWSSQLDRLVELVG